MIKAAFEYITERCTNKQEGGKHSALQLSSRGYLQGCEMSALQGGDQSALQAGCSSALQAGHMSALQGGDQSALQAGHMSALQGGHISALQGGDQSVLLGGDMSKMTAGKYSVVYGCGHKAQVRGGIGSVLALAEFDDHGNIIKVHVKTVDGKKIKADTFYQLENGKFVEVNEVK